VRSFVLACLPGSASWLWATPAPALPSMPVVAPLPPPYIRTSPRLPPRLKNAVVTDSPACGQETLLLEGEWIGETQVLMRLWRSCRTSALALVSYLPARSRSPVAPDAVHRGTLPGDAGRSVPGRRPSEHNKCISMQSCVRRFCACNSAEQLLLPAHLLQLCKACADVTRVSVHPEHDAHGRGGQETADGRSSQHKGARRGGGPDLCEESNTAALRYDEA